MNQPPGGAINFLALSEVWTRPIASQQRPKDIPAWAAQSLIALGVLGVLFIAFDLLISPTFLAYDSMQDYAHVWFINDQIFHHASLPLRIAVLDSGHAATFPYGLVPYIAGAFLFELFGNWSMVLMMTTAMLGTIWAVTLVRPEMRNPWLLLLFLMNPFFIDSTYAFQFPTVWTFLFFFLFVWAFEHRRHVLAAVLMWLTVSTHPVIGGVTVAGYVVAIALFDRERLRALAMLSIPVSVALLPVAWMSLSTPSVQENSLTDVILAALRALPRRETIVLAPFALSALAPIVLRNYRVFLLGSTLSLAAGLIAATSTLAPWADGSYYGAIHTSRDIYASFFASPQFHPGQVYRVMEPNDREDGMYYFIQHGAVLGNEFFTESTYRINWSASSYQCFVAFKHIDYVSIESAYQAAFGTNEQALLESLVASGEASVTYTDPGGAFKIYNMRPFAGEQPPPASLGQCAIQ